MPKATQMDPGESTDSLARKMASSEYPVAGDPAEFGVSYASSLTPKALQVLVDFRVLHPDGRPVLVSLEKPDHAPLGRGPMLEERAWQAMVSADTTPDQRWLTWIFTQAAGGEQAKEASKRALEQIHKRFIDERVSGFTHADTRAKHDAVTRQMADERWSTRKLSKKTGKLKPSPEERFARFLGVEFGGRTSAASQDEVDKLQCYGFYRKWPGTGQRNYADIVKAVSKFISLEPLAIKLNKLLKQGKGMGEASVSLHPEDYDNVQAVVTASQRIERFFAAQKASKDVRLANEKYVYSDDFVTVVVPLTYAAAVKYGWPEWAWANRENFQTLLRNRESKDHWKEYASKSVFAIMHFKEPMPGWVSRRRNEFKTVTLTNVGVQMPLDKLASLRVDNLVFWDEENKSNVSYNDIAAIILSEPDKPEDTEQDKILPVKSWKVYKTKEEAQRAKDHFDQALKALCTWARSFDPKQVKGDTLSL